MQREELTYEEIEDLYQELLNETSDVMIAGYHKWHFGDLLRKMDPIAFRCGVADWSSEEFEELKNGYYARVH